MEAPHGMRWLAPVMLLIPLGGCGWIFVSGPPADQANLAHFACTESKTPPMLDVIWGGLMVVGAVRAITTSEDAWDNHYYPDRKPAIALYLGWGVVSGLAARSGFRKVNTCRDALQERAERSKTKVNKPTQQDWHPPMLQPTVRQVPRVPSLR